MLPNPFMLYWLLKPIGTGVMYLFGLNPPNPPEAAEVDIFQSKSFRAAATIFLKLRLPEVCARVVAADITQHGAGKVQRACAAQKCIDG